MDKKARKGIALEKTPFKQKSCYFFLLLLENVCRGTYQTRLGEALLMGTNNIRFHAEIRQYFSDTPCI